MLPADLALLERLQTETLDVLRTVVGPTAEVALLDYPNHDNVGDCLIWCGERNYLRRLGIRVAYACDLRKLDVDLLRRRLPEGPILLQGGGNWGDIYDAFQEFRETVVEAFPDRKIVQMPQSIWFASEEKAARANRIFSEHPDFTLLVRDHASMERCRAQLPAVRVVFCHDAALGVGPVRHRKPRVPLVALMRQDVESDQAPGGASVGEVVDWGLTGLRKHVDTLLRLPGWVSRRASPRATRALYPLVARCMELAARNHVAAGADLLGRGQRVITDRLHAHVLCSLMGVPHVTLDNTYGKIAAVQEASTGGFSTARPAASRRLDEAEVRALLT